MSLAIDFVQRNCHFEFPCYRKRWKIVWEFSNLGKPQLVRLLNIFSNIIFSIVHHKNLVLLQSCLSPAESASILGKHPPAFVGRICNFFSPAERERADIKITVCSGC